MWENKSINSQKVKLASGTASWVSQRKYKKGGGGGGEVFSVIAKSFKEIRWVKHTYDAPSTPLV